MRVEGGMGLPGSVCAWSFRLILLPGVSQMALTLQSCEPQTLAVDCIFPMTLQLLGLKLALSAQKVSAIGREPVDANHPRS